MLPPTYVQGFHDEDAVRQMQYRKLGDTGMVVSALGFGASALAGVFHDVTQEECIQVVHQTLKAGVNVIDSAPWYGQGKSETLLGVALKDVPRSAYYLNTKVGRYLPQVDCMFDFSRARVTESVGESLSRLQLDYIDTIQIHDIEFAPNLDIIVEQTLPALDALRALNKVRKIGITGYALAPILEVLQRSSVKIDVVLSYARMTLLDCSLARDLLPLLHERKIGLVNAAPTAMALLTPQGPPAWHPASHELKSTARQVVELCAASNVSITRLALKVSIADARLPTTLMSFAKLSHMEDNLRAAREAMTEEEAACLSRLYASDTIAKDSCMHWEGVEVAKYWEKVGKKLLTEKLYGST